MSNKKLMWGIVFSFVLACPISVNADFTGDDIFGVFEAPTVFPGDNLWDGTGGATTSDPIVATVGAGDEYSVTFGATFFADFSADELVFGIDTVTPTVIGDNLILDFTDLNGSGDIIDVDVLGSDFVDVELNFGADSLSVFIPDQVADNPILNLGFTFSSSIPEPGSASILLAIGAYIFSSRRKRS